MPLFIIMTDKERILEKLKPMGYLYKDAPGNTEDGKKVWQAYIDALANYSNVELIERACDHYVRTSTNIFFPAFSDLVRSIKAILALDYPDKTEAWKEVAMKLRQGKRAELEFSHNLIKETVITMGWTYLCESDNIGMDRHMFFKLYEELRDKEIEQYLSNRR